MEGSSDRDYRRNSPMASRSKFDCMLPFAPWPRHMHHHTVCDTLQSYPGNKLKVTLAVNDSEFLSYEKCWFCSSVDINTENKKKLPSKNTLDFDKINEECKF